MGRTAKKRKILGQKKKTQKVTEQLRYIYLLKNPLRDLHQRQLPSSGNT